MKVNYNQSPIKVIETNNNCIASFDVSATENIDEEVVNSFGEEWKKFGDFSEEVIQKVGAQYFDIIPEGLINSSTSMIDIGCGTGRWSKYWLDKVGHLDLVDPSEAIFVADQLIGKKEHVRLSQATTDNLPFEDNSFDFGMSIGVLHHIPDTQKAMNDCVKKIKTGGHFFTYLYYDFNDRGWMFQAAFRIANLMRKSVSKMTNNSKRLTCDLIAIFVYMPFVLVGRLLNVVGLKKVAQKLPLSFYQDQTFFVIRNDALDRFGTQLEQRFSKSEVISMMENAGLSEIVVSENAPYWHALGKKSS